ncbi:MAG TPA: PHP domain-containing protein [Planctomycetota bacterium]|nr:PHP domain-containing protein [Planctomycetota bacterium]
MTPLDANAVSRLLIEIGRRLELAGESPFKFRAYYKAAENLMALTEPISDIIARGKLREIPGVGEAIAEKIIKLHRTGTHPTLELMREQVPASVLEMFGIPGLGARRIAILHAELNITDLAALEEACKAGKLEACKGLGAAIQKKILQGLEFMRKGSGLRHMDDADTLLRAACANLQKSHADLKRIVPAGASRRGCELVDELVIVAQNSGQEIEFNKDLRLIVSDEAHYGVKLLFATGSSDHLELLAAHAKALGFRLDENGLFNEKSSRVPKGEVLCKDERDVYAALELPFIEPELREGRALAGEKNEIECAKKNKLPRLVGLADIRGILHSHTEFSDGSETLATMAEATRERGYFYYGVADHSKSAAYAGGLKEEEIAAQHKLADELNAEYARSKTTFRIFKGIESDILEDGSLDYSDSVLKTFDFIVASVHSRFTLKRDAQTQRLINAVSHPRTTILGHMTGRLLLRREPYDVDVDAVLRACAKNGVVVEINANPYRLDVDWRFHQRALELGCMLSINPDAHSISELDLTQWGVRMARKGGVPKERVLNCMELDAISEYFARRRAR